MFSAANCKYFSIDDTLVKIPNVCHAAMSASSRCEASRADGEKLIASRHPYELLVGLLNLDRLQFQLLLLLRNLVEKKTSSATMNFKVRNSRTDSSRRAVDETL